MAIERLSPEDELILWPDAIWPQDVGALVVLDGAGLFDRAGRLRLEAVRGVVAGRLHLVPRFRQLLFVPPSRLGGPLWIDAPAFDVAEHVGVREVPAPGDDAAVLRVVEELRRRRLDRSRPLWEMWFLTGLAGGRVGLFVRVHHTMADGIAAVATFATFLDLSADGATTSEAAPWAPAPAPTEAELRADYVRRRALAWRRALARSRHPLRSAREVFAAWPFIRGMLTSKRVPSTSLDRVIKQDRALALIRSRLEVVKAIAHAHEATVNDVLLTATAAGLRELLRHRGESVEGRVVKVFVPMSLRLAERATARGNLISEISVPLPVGVADPGERLRQVAAETARRKNAQHPSLGHLPHHGVAGRLMLMLLNRDPINVVTADIPGPEAPLYFAGARLLEVFPFVNLVWKQTLGIAAMSYAGGFNIAVIADADTCPDLDVFAAGVRRELDVLEDAVAVSHARKAVA